jgi:hypothetical protein
MKVYVYMVLFVLAITFFALGEMSASTNASVAVGNIHEELGCVARYEEVLKNAQND